MTYLKDHNQRTVVCKNNVRSKTHWEKIKTDIPQWSILGPLLFLLYINDLPNNISSKLIFFADDTTAILKLNSLNQFNHRVSKTVEKMSYWFKSNGIKLNQGKTQLVNFCTWQARDSFDSEVLFQGQEIPLECTKFLGINIDGHLSWNKGI